MLPPIGNLLISEIILECDLNSTCASQPSSQPRSGQVCIPKQFSSGGPPLSEIQNQWYHTRVLFVVMVAMVD